MKRDTMGRHDLHIRDGLRRQHLVTRGTSQKIAFLSSLVRFERETNVSRLFPPPLLIVSNRERNAFEGEVEEEEEEEEKYSSISSLRFLRLPLLPLDSRNFTFQGSEGGEWGGGKERETQQRPPLQSIHPESALRTLAKLSRETRPSPWTPATPSYPPG